MKSIYTGQVVGKFKENPEAEGGYTDELESLYLIIGTIPAKGDWQIVTLNHWGSKREIPEADLKTREYEVGGYEIVMRNAGLQGKDKPAALDLTTLRELELSSEGGEDDD